MSIRGGPVPGSPAFRQYEGTQPPIAAGSTRVPITFQGTPTPGEVLSFVVGTDATSVNPDTLKYAVLSTDTLATIAAAVATLIEAAITAGGNAWATDFASTSSTNNVTHVVLAGGANINTTTIAVSTYPGSLIDVLPTHYPEVTANATEVTALKSFSYAGPTGVFRAYKNQILLVDKATAADMLAQGLAE